MQLPENQKLRKIEFICLKAIISFLEVKGYQFFKKIPKAIDQTNGPLTLFKNPPYKHSIWFL